MMDNMKTFAHITILYENHVQFYKDNENAY